MAKPADEKTQESQAEQLKETPMAKPADEKTQESQAEQLKETPMAKPTVDPHAGLVKMHRDGNNIHAHPTVVKEHEKNGWKVV